MVMEMKENAMDATVEGPREKLREILEKNGETILQDYDRVEGLLRDHCGSYRKEISALVGALHERVPLELKGSWQTAMTPEAMRARLVQRLEDHRGLAPEVAAWAVDTWSYALGIGLGRRSDRLDSVVLNTSSSFNSAGQQNNAAIGSPTAGLPFDRARSDAERKAAIDSDRPGRSSSPTGLLATPAQKKKAGLGVGALVLAVLAAFAVSHRPPAPAPAPVVVVTPPQHEVPKPTPKAPEVTPAPTPTPAPTMTSIPVGTAIQVRLNQGIDSDNATVGETFTASLAAPLTLEGKIILPVGSDATITVASIDPGGKITGQTLMQLSLLELSSGGKRYKVSAGMSPILGPKQAVVATERGAVGGAIGAVSGFIGGKLFHHAKPATVIGAGAGAGIGVATTKPQPAKAKAEQLLRFKLTKAIKIGA